MLFSVIIPVFNPSDKLRSCLESLAPLWADWWSLTAELSALPRLPFRSRLLLRTVGALHSRAVARLLYRAW